MAIRTSYLSLLFFSLLSAVPASPALFSDPQSFLVARQQGVGGAHPSDYASISERSQSPPASVNLRVPVLSTHDQGEFTSPVDSRFIGFSIELANWQNYTGTPASPNSLSHRILQELKDRAGGSPSIRVGGNTEDHLIYMPDQKTEPEVQLFLSNSTQAYPEADNVTVSPAFFDLHKLLPSGIDYTFGLNLRSNNLSGTIAVAKAAWKSSWRGGGGLTKLEIGNEANLYKSDFRNQSTWNERTWVQNWNNFSTSVASALGFDSKSKVFQIGAISHTPGPNWTAQDVINFGTDLTNVRAGVIHHYYFAECTTSDAMQVNSVALTSPKVLKEILDQRWPVSAAELYRSKGLEYYIGESGSVTCHGHPGVSNAHTASIFIVTYYLTALTSYIQRIYNHQGYGFYYATWEPQSIPGFPTLVNPQYSGLLMIADFISGSSTSKDPWRVVQLPLPAGSNDTLSAWAIYEGGELTSTKQGWGDDDQSPGLLQDAGLRRLILTNGQSYNTTNTYSRPETTFYLTLGPGGIDLAKRTPLVKRLTAPGMDTLNQTVYAGQNWASGKPVSVGGDREYLVNGTITLKAGEAVLVDFTE